MIEVGGFVLCLVVVIGASALLGRVLERLGVRFRLSEGLFGLLTALAADAPEISTAIVAMAAGKKDLGTGIVLGSNLFNLAVLLGLSALVAGKIRVARTGFASTALSALLVTGLATALVLGALSPWLTALGLTLVLIPYVAFSALRPETFARLPTTSLFRRFSPKVRSASDVAVEEAAAQLQQAERHSLPLELLLLIGLLGAIVGGSIGLVHEAEPLAASAAIPRHLVGPLVLAGLTGVPNAIAALRLAHQGRGSALVSEAFNSNTINVVVGICLPALLLGIGAPAHAVVLAVWWLTGATATTIALIALAQKIGRREGALIVAVYVAFVIALIVT